jgi:hypothetical protein
MSLKLLQGSLLIASIGAIAILLGLFGTAVGIAGLVAIALGTIVAAPAAREGGGGWWGLLAIGAALSVLGALLSLVSETVGGLVAVLGGVAVITGAAMGFPVGGLDR